MLCRHEKVIIVTLGRSDGLTVASLHWNMIFWMRVLLRVISLAVTSCIFR